MKKRGTISRCCCGGGGGTGSGFCTDSCLSSWNSCPPSANGDVTLSLGSAWSNCDWVNTGSLSPTGSDGDFLATAVFGFNSLSDLTKHFSFDYRTATTLEIQSDVEVFQGGIGGAGTAGASAGISLMGSAELTLSSGRQNANGQVTLGRIRATGGYNVATLSTSATFKLVATIGAVQSTRVGSYSYFNGSESVTTSGCIDSLSVDFDCYVDGALVQSFAAPVDFPGARCYNVARVLLYPTGVPASPTIPATAETSAMTITVT